MPHRCAHDFITGMYKQRPRLMMPHWRAEEMICHEYGTVQVTVGEPAPQSQTRRIQAVRKLWENLTTY